MKKVAVCAWLSQDGHTCSRCLDTTVVAGFSAVYLLTWPSEVDSQFPSANFILVDVNAIWPGQSVVQMAFSATGDSLRSLEVASCLRYAAESVTLSDCSHVCIIECDSIWVQKWESLGFFGVEFGSVVSRRRLLSRTSTMDLKTRSVNHYCQKPFDMRRLGLPFQFASESAILRSIAEDVIRIFSSMTSGCNFSSGAMGALVLRHVNAHGLRGAITTESTFRPMHTLALASED